MRYVKIVNGNAIPVDVTGMKLVELWAVGTEYATITDQVSGTQFRKTLLKDPSGKSEEAWVLED